MITTSSDLSSSTSTNPPDTGHEDAAAATDAQSDNESERGQKRDEPGQGDDKLTSDKEGKEGDAGGQEEMADQTGKCVQEQVQEVKEGKETGGQECQVTIIPDSKAKTTPGKKEGRDGEEERNETVGECKLTTPVGGESKPGDKVKEEKDMDVYLIQLEGILKKIHQKFYQEFDEKQRYRDEGEVIKVPDLKDIIPKIKKQVLHGCTIVFSGVIPTGVPTASSRIHRLATSLGAKVSDSVTVQRVDPCPSRTGMTPAAMFAPQERTTHVVASKFGTVKVRSAQKDPRIKVVNPLWLYACAENWERVSEDGYLLREEDDFQSHPLVAAEKKLLSSRDPAAAGHSFRTSSSSSPPSASPPGTSKEVEVTASEDPGDGLMEHPLNQLSMFSSRELQCMDKEVEDACSEGDDMDDSSDEDDKRAPNVTLKRMRESSSEDSMDGECPKGWQSERRKKQSISPSPEEEEDQGTVDSDVAFGPAGGFISESSSSDSPGGSGSSGSLDGAADLLEREFLS